jgi:hypothetical protein
MSEIERRNKQEINLAEPDVVRDGIFEESGERYLAVIHENSRS